jgi:cell division protein FtsB
MRLVEEIRRRLRSIVGPVLGITLVAYFAFHLFAGERGLMAWMQLSQELRDAQATYAAVHGEEQALEHRVALLRSDHLDPDMLDERARSVLHLGAPGEIVIPRGADRP